MKNLILCGFAILTMLSLASCGAKSTAVIGAPGPTNSTPSKTWNDQKINQSLCTGQVVPLTGRWTSTQYAGGITRVATLYIQSNATSLSYTCTEGSLSRSATATVPSSIATNRLFYLDSNTNSSTGSSRQLACTATINKGYSPYKIVGQCLILTIDDGQHTFTYLGN